jgi:hypothetical protein
MPEVNTPIGLLGILGALEARLNKAIDDYLFNVRIRSKELIGKGIAPEQVQAMFLDEIQNNTGDYKKLTGAIGAEIDKAINQTALGTSNQYVAPLSREFRWDAEPSAKHCSTCSDYDGQIKTYDDWQQSGLPGEGLTECGVYCKCSLQPV